MTGQRDDPGRKGTLTVTILPLNWMALDNLIKIMASVDEKITSHKPAQSEKERVQ